jgi:hypothetical protein
VRTDMQQFAVAVRRRLTPCTGAFLIVFLWFCRVVWENRQHSSNYVDVFGVWLSDVGDK